MQRILRGAELKKYRVVLLECKESEKDLVGDGWALSKLKGVSIEDLCTLSNIDGFNYDGDAYLRIDKCVNFEK